MRWFQIGLSLDRPYNNAGLEVYTGCGATRNGFDRLPNRKQDGLDF